ncbi:MAG: Amt family ammonium transporter [Methylophilaceae bacterium]|jgi:Amt family ammonium transporter
MGISVALIGGFVIYGGLKKTMGLRMSDEEQYDGADLSIHKISATAED